MTARAERNAGADSGADITTDVVIAGGGPVGLMLACELGLAGVRTVVLERAGGRPTVARAWGLHARTVETLDRRGLLDGLTHEKAPWPKMPFAGLWPLLALDRIDADHPYLLNVPQTRVEEVLEARAGTLGVRVLRQHDVVGLAQDADGVTATVAVPGGELRVRGGYLVGCDGGRSVVRKLAGIGFPGTGPTVGGMLCDCSLPTMAEERRGITRTDVGTVNINPRPNGVVRIVTNEFGRPHPDRDAPVTFEEFRGAVRRILGRDLAIADPTFMTRFGDTTRLADRYAAGRVLLAGDAAHVHFPYGGLGLNLGLQDAANLGWKLAARVRGWAPDGLLESYEAERRPAAAGVLDYSRTQLALLDPSRNVTALRELFSRLLEIPEVNLRLARLATGAGLRYDLGDGHPLTGSFARDLALTAPDGDTTLVRLLHPGRGLLLDFSGKAQGVAAPWSSRVRVVRAEGVERPPADALLIRPDGYAVWAAGPGDAETEGLRAALTTWFGVA
ncbi:FAD-dependent monooxygenase [Streptomyces sp. NPDC102283]|uniref:FAD-dependent monooxygenase n=1 Tax=Streptomyces sp. NPDC102283 TaxID=3366155 RepID=UPI0037FA85C2